MSCYFNKFVICYDISKISIFDLLINSWYYLLYKRNCSL